MNGRKILIPHDRLSVDFEITDDRELVLLSFSSQKEQERFAQPAIPKEKQHTFRALEIQCTEITAPSITGINIMLLRPVHPLPMNSENNIKTTGVPNWR